METCTEATATLRYALLDTDDTYADEDVCFCGPGVSFDEQDGNTFVCVDCGGLVDPYLR
jgi:hypothetical protein